MSTGKRMKKFQLKTNTSRRTGAIAAGQLTERKQEALEEEDQPNAEHRGPLGSQEAALHAGLREERSQGQHKQE